MRRPQPLAEIMVAGSAYSRNQLKNRLYRECLKARRCEVCGQGELWRGRAMWLSLDHVNGVRDDHRIENLRIPCPSCAATLDTHCGRENRAEVEDRECLLCGRSFRPSYVRQRYCSRECGRRAPNSNCGVPNVGLRRVERPPHDELVREIDATSYLAVGAQPRRLGQRVPQVGAPVRAGAGGQRCARAMTAFRRLPRPI